MGILNIIYNEHYTAFPYTYTPQRVFFLKIHRTLEQKVSSEIISNSSLTRLIYGNKSDQLFVPTRVGFITFKSVLMRWMKQEPIIQSEVSQKEKHQYSILMYIYGIYKGGNDDPICSAVSSSFAPLARLQNK